MTGGAELRRKKRILGSLEVMENHSTVFQKTKMNSIHSNLDEQTAEVLAYSNLRYPRYGEDPETGWSRGTQILGACCRANNVA